MTEFWETNFQQKQTMWGLEPADAAIATANLFLQNGLHNILIPGFGYGRNAIPFTEKGCQVTGIEISATAIELAQQQYDHSIKIYHGSVTGMPFDQVLYDGIFCYALIHLLDEPERNKLIRDCYQQLRPGGLMVFVAISTSDTTFGQGEALSPNRFLTKHGVQLYFYDLEAVEKEFGNVGLIKAKEIDESASTSGEKPSQKFWLVTCIKKRK